MMRELTLILISSEE